MIRIVTSPHGFIRWTALASLALSLLAACSGNTADALASNGNDSDAGVPDSGGTTNDDAGGGASTTNDAGAVDGATSVTGDAASNGAAAAAPYPTSLSAATSTATTNAACTSITPFYWEIGNATSALASGSATGAAQIAITATDKMPIASASKWLYSSYWVERTKNVLSTSDIQFFNFQSGYNSFSSCSGTLTVGTCATKNDNGVLTRRPSESSITAAVTCRCTRRKTAWQT